MAPPMLITRRGRRAMRPILFLLVGLAIAGLALAAPAGIRAQSGCDPQAPVACIPLPPAPAPQPGAGAPTPGIAAVPVAAYPCPVVDPYGPPVPVPASPVVPGCCEGTAPSPVNTPAVPVPVSGCCGPLAVESPSVIAQPAAPAVPVPPGYCPPLRGIYATINLGNAADVRALSTLSTAGLRAEWRRGVLAQIAGQVVNLESRGVYATPRLYSIEVQNTSVQPDGSVVVQTLEHWRYQERWQFDDSIAYEQDEWVANEYDLNLIGGIWYITGNTATLVPAP